MLSVKDRQNSEMFGNLLAKGDAKALSEWLKTTGYKPTPIQAQQMHTKGIIYNPTDNSIKDTRKNPAITPPPNTTPTEGIAKAQNVPTNLPAIDGSNDRSKVNKEGLRQKDLILATGAQQTTLQQQRLADLAKLLGEQQDTTFNREIPDIANTAQNQGFLETSGFGNALARERAKLTQDTSLALAKQGLTDRDLQIANLDKAGTAETDFRTAGLGREFSVEDQARADALARELGRMGVPSQKSQGQNFLQGAVAGAGAGAAFGPTGAIVGGVAGGVANSK